MKPEHSMFHSLSRYGVMNNLYGETGKGDEDEPVVRGTVATPKVGPTVYVSAPSAIKVSPVCYLYQAFHRP